MIVCTKCGTENPEGTQFCQKCGGYLDWSGVKVAVQTGSAVSATLKSPDVAVDAGGQASCEVEVHNDGRLVDEYRLQVSGADPSWASIDPVSLRLMPKTSASARVLFRPPRASDPAAGTGPFLVTATSTVDRAVRTEVAGSLTIHPFADVAATLMPQTSESFDVAEHTVSVENRGNAANRVRLTAQDADNRLTCDVEPSDITIPRGSTARARLSVRPSNPKEPRAARRLPFQVLVQPGVGTPIRLDGATVLLQASVSWWWKWRLAIAAALILMLVTGVVAIAGPPYPHWPIVPPSTATRSPSSPPSPAVAKLTTKPASVSFGTVQVGAGSAAMSVTVANSGAGKTTVTAQLSETKDFSMQDLCSSAPLGPDQQCQFQITFTPQAEGDFGATLSFTVDNGTAPATVALSGHGQGHAVLTCLPPSVSFNVIVRTGVAAQTSTVSQDVTCTNSGNGALAINSVLLQDSTGKFKIQPNCGQTLGPGATCTVSVQFSTSTVGTTFNASILINDALGQQVIPVTGFRGYFFICVACIKLVSPASVN